MGVIRYSGHTAGSSDTLAPFESDVWNWESESINLSKTVNAIGCLPGMPTTGTDGYGVEVVTDQMPWVETRTFNSSCISHAQLNEILQYAKVRNSGFKLTTVTGFEFTGRFISFSANQNESSAFYNATLTLRATSNEKSDSTLSVHILSNPST